MGIYNDEIRVDEFPGLVVAIRLGVRRLIGVSGRGRVRVVK